MRIAVDTLSLDRSAGGILQYFSAVMTELWRAGAHEYAVLFAGDGRLLDEILPAVWRSSAVAAGDTGAVERLLQRADLLYTPGPVLRRRAPIASVVTIADVLEAYFPDHFSRGQRLARYLLHGAAARAANRVVTLSEFSRAGIAAFYRVPAQRIEVAPPAPADLSRADVGSRLPALPAEFLLYPANAWRHKNHLRLLAALATARDRHGITLPCVLTGAPVRGGCDVAAAIEAKRLGDQVAHLGFVDTATLATLYRRARALVFPSLFEGFGLPVAEAMANGVAVACADSAGLAETAGDAALYFPADDTAAMAAALIRIWNDGALRSELIDRGRRRARRFTAEALGEAHARAFAAAREDFAARGAPLRSPGAAVVDFARAAGNSLRRAPFCAALPPARATP